MANMWIFFFVIFNVDLQMWNWKLENLIKVVSILGTDEETCKSTENNRIIY